LGTYSGSAPEEDYSKEWMISGNIITYSCHILSHIYIIIIIIIIIGNTPTGGAMQNCKYFKYQYNTIDT